MTMTGVMLYTESGRSEYDRNAARQAVFDVVREWLGGADRITAVYASSSKWLVETAAGRRFEVVKGESLEEGRIPLKRPLETSVTAPVLHLFEGSCIMDGGRGRK